MICNGVAFGLKREKRVVLLNEACTSYVPTCTAVMLEYMAGAVAFGLEANVS